MSLQSTITKNCTQTAVYWRNPVDDHYGGKTFDDPIEIKCRWEDKKQVIQNPDGTSMISRAVVIVLQDVDYEGLLYLTTLSSLTTSQKANPREIEDICIIKRFEKTPELGSSTNFYRKAFLTPWLT